MRKSGVGQPHSPLVLQRASFIRYVAPLACTLAWTPAARAQTDEIQVYDAEMYNLPEANYRAHNAGGASLVPCANSARSNERGAI